MNITLIDAYCLDINYGDYFFHSRLWHVLILLLRVNSLLASVLPKSEPRIEPADGEVSDAALPTNYKPGDTLSLICESPPSYPEPTLRWTINGKSVGAQRQVALASIVTRVLQ